MTYFTPTDLDQLQQLGISTKEVENQLQTFTEGIPFVQLDRAAIIGDGIKKIDPSEEQEYIAYYEAHAKNKSLLKFVPASGAASRMFKALFSFLEHFEPKKESFEAYVNRTNDTEMEAFVKGMKMFSFYENVLARIEGTYRNEDDKIKCFVEEMLLESGLNYGFYPKGLLPFHRCLKGSATPFKEHLKEAAAYAKTDGKACLHFTISPQHEALFKKEEEISKPRIAQKTDTFFDISYSFQKPSTDTIAANLDNTPFRNTDGSMLFRPGGHGALIENLNEQDADVIFIKNIDNVVIDENLESVARSKKILAGVLLSVQNKTFEYLKELEKGVIENEELLVDFATSRLNLTLPLDFTGKSNEEKIKWFASRFNRPIRVCGMVKNEGEPGGGPFWINHADGQRSLQIIESAQVDTTNTNQKKLFQQATHFNPVDLVCGIKDYQGNKFDLLQFVDDKQGFIAEKTKDGKPLKALERPGLWNGAMAYWNTIFVEVPLLTFNPVKTVNDLLKPTHQA